MAESKIEVLDKKVNFKKQEYLAQVTIMEATEIKGKDSSGTSDVFVKITIANLPSQVTTTAKSSTSAVWNQSFTFTNVKNNMNLNLYF